MTSYDAVPSLLSPPLGTDPLSEEVAMSLVLADPAGRYISAGVIQISVTNAVIIGLMILVFVLAIVLPFPGRRRHDRSGRDS